MATVVVVTAIGVVTFESEAVGRFVDRWPLPISVAVVSATVDKRFRSSIGAGVGHSADDVVDVTTVFGSVKTLLAVVRSTSSFRLYLRPFPA